MGWRAKPTAAIETARLVLRPATLEEVQAYDHGLSRAVEADREHFVFFLGVRRDNGRVVSSFSLERGHMIATTTVYIDWATNANERGKGYATEGASAVVAWAYRQPDIERVCAVIRDGNNVSKDVAKKLGFVPTAEMGLWELPRARVRAD